MERTSFVQVTPRIWKLDLPLFGGVMRVGVWLVEGDDGWTMVDTGLPRDAETIHRATMDRTNGQPPARIILTHGHYDHAGSLQNLWQRWSVPVLAHHDEAPFLTGQAGYDSVRPAWWGYRILQTLARGSRPAPVPSVDHLTDGDSIAGMEVRHVPGHAPGMIALIHRGDRAVICGDTFVSRDGRLHLPVAVFTPDRAGAIRSMRTLSEEDVDHVLPSHGQPILAKGKEEAQQAVARCTGGS